MKKHFALCLLTVIVILSSCQKESSTDSNTATIEGTYKLKYLTSKTNSTITGDDGEKAVTTSDYTTIDNQGTILFDNSNLSATGLTYTVDTIANVYLYQDNQLINSSSYPFQFTLPVSNSVASYKLIGADSIYFPGGSLTSGVGGSGSIPTGPSGGRYSLNGKLLTLTQNASKDSTFVDSGITFHMTESAVSSVVMEKQ
jgi:hypothetical protein